MTLDARLAAALSGRYSLEREVGAGGMATVYRAHDVRHNRKVAVKVLKPELAAIIGAERFVREIEVTAGLEHPHILPLYDSGEADGFLYYVMPFVEGESLRARLERERQLPVAEAVRIVDEVADALSYAHGRGIVHRDIKPENVLLRDGRALLADFGIALAIRSTAGTRLTETGLSLGTPSYMSPEQAAGEQVDHRSDLYAAGCLLYEMLAGRPPHVAPTAQAVLARVLTGTPEPVQHEREATPANVAAAVHKAIARLPADRFTSAAEFRAALTDPGFGATLPAAPARTAVPWIPVLGALAAGLFLGTLLRPVTRAQPDAPRGAHLQLVLPAGVNLPLDADYPVLAVSPDGSRIVFVGAREGRRELYSRLLADSVSRLIRGTEGALAPVFSPDGAWIAFLSGPMLFKVAASGGSPIPIHRVSGEGVERGVAWVSDSVLVLVGSANSGLLSGTVSEGRVGRNADWDTLTSSSLPAVWPHGVAGRSDVLFARSAAADATETDVALYSFEVGESRVLVSGASSPRFSSTGHLLFARGSVLYGMGYDPDRRAAVGPEREVARGVAAGGQGVSHFAVGGGVLAWVAGAAIPAEFELVWVDRRGEVVGTLDEGRQYAGPRLSPDGNRVAVTVTVGPNLDVWVLDTTRGILQPLTRHPGEDFDPVWSPDGRSLAIASEIGEDHGEQGPGLAWIPEPGGATQQLVFSPAAGAWEFPTSWTPDGNAIVVTVRREDASADIALVSPAGNGELQPIVATPADEVGARISPNGRWLAYTSNRSGRNEIWIRPYPGPGSGLQVSTDGGVEPVWSRDSRELFYRSAFDMMVVSVASGPDPAPSPPVRLFTKRFEPTLFGGESANFDVSRDGQRFIMVRRKQSVEPTVIEVALDWPAVLLRSGDRSPN